MLRFPASCCWPFSPVKDRLFHSWCNKAELPVPLFPLTLRRALCSWGFEALVKTRFRIREEKSCGNSLLGEQKVHKVFGGKKSKCE